MLLAYACKGDPRNSVPFRFKNTIFGIFNLLEEKMALELRSDIELRHAIFGADIGALTCSFQLIGKISIDF
jgi:hypothetical protein